MRHPGHQCPFLRAAKIDIWHLRLFRMDEANKSQNRTLGKILIVERSCRHRETKPRKAHGDEDERTLARIQGLQEFCLTLNNERYL
jgi:hypothetical protein